MDIEQARKQLLAALSFDGGAVEGSVYSSTRWREQMARAIEDMIDAKLGGLKRNQP